MMNVKQIWALIRPKQWLKNLLIFFPLFLNGGLAHAGIIWRMGIPFAAFCCASSASYILNDFLDREQDAVHPEKKFRPIASGKVSAKTAGFLAAGLSALAVVLGGLVSLTFISCLLVYLGVSLLYSLKLKDLPIIDVFCISLGFILRLFAGGTAFSIQISDWLFLSVFFLSIFLSVGKRFSERLNLGENAGAHRPSLAAYPDGFLESALYLSGAIVLVTYAMYTVGKPFLIYSVPLCMFGLLRYLLRIKSGQGGDPTEALLKDTHLLATGVLWVVWVGLSVYR
jgi:decaprenyl-phosphate phosphoribosyltransferase